MTDQTTKLVEQLAQKLGTTTEYLWSILLKQAPIDATITLFQILLVIIFGVALYKVHKRFLKKDDKIEKPFYNRNTYETYEEYATYPMVGLTIVFAFLVIASLFSIESVINGYLNPEYWALNKILSSINQN